MFILICVLLDQPVTYTNWVPGHQSDDFEDCVVLMPYKQGQWHDVPCGDPDDDDPDPDTTESHHFICEFGMRRSVFEFANSVDPDETSHLD